jgi:hydrogenase small subunit
MRGVGGCANVGGICIGCTTPGFPEKLMPFMNQPPGSLLSTEAIGTYGASVRTLRRFTRDSLHRPVTRSEALIELRLPNGQGPAKNQATR